VPQDDRPELTWVGIAVSVATVSNNRATPQPSELNFGTIILVLLATLTIAVALMFPDAQVATTDFLSGP
jgi:hypothetical protein